MIDLEELFETVVILVRETPESSFEHPTSTAEKVELYGLYKHVREGPCDGHDLPSVFYAVARAKYQAWRACESLTAQEAMMEYIQLAASKDHWKTKALLEEYQRETKDSNTTTTISSLRSVFDNVASFVRDEHTTPGLELSSATALQLEGLYKHLTVGTCVSDVLATLDATEKAQHQAWWACKQKSKEQAMLEYIQSVASYQDHWVGRKAQELLQDYRQLQRSKSFAEGNVEESLENEHPKSVSATIINANDNAHDTPIIQATTASEENESKPTHGIKLAVSKSVVRPTAKENIAVDPKPSRFSVYTTYLFGLFGVHPLIPRGQIDISYSDLFFALMQCCRYWRSSMIRYQTLYQQIQDVWSFDGSGVAVGLSARSLLDLYLCLKKYPAGSEVIMIPPISVPGMCHVLKYHDLSIIPVDCPLGISLEATQEAITDKTVAIMVVHAFGKIYASPEEFQQLRQLADAHNVELWEDGAECFAGLGESCYRGSVCADLRFCSFGMIKTATAIGGGVVLLRDKAFAKQMQGLQHSFYKQQSASEYLSRIVMGLIIKTLGASPLLYGLLAAICSLLGLNFDSFVTALLRGFVIQSPSSNSVKDKRDEERQIQSHMVQQIRKRPSPALLAVLHRRLKQSRRRTPGIDARLNRCQRMAAILQERVPDMTIQYTQACTEHTYWLFPIRCHNRESVSRQMLKAGFDVAQGASQLCCVSKFTDEGMCPESEKLMSELLYLPVSSRNLSEAMMAELARALQIASTMAGKGDSTASQNVLHLKTAKMLNLPVAIGAIAHLAFLHSSKSGSFLQPLIGLITMILGTSICVLLIFAIGLLVLRWLAASFYLESRSFAKYSNLVQESECGVRSIDAENKTTNAIDTHPHVLSSPMGTLNVPDTQVTNKSVIQFMTALKFPRTSVLGQSTTNKVILTGATGFIGSLLLRDILMHREALSIGGGVIILCRKKRNESAQARIQKLLADPMFAFLSDEDKRKLVHVVQGDVTHPEAGLSPGDIELVCEDPSISHVFHCAASVSFTQDLPGAAKANITSSLNIQSLTGKLKNEDVQYVQISTAFIHGGLSGTAVLPLHEKLHSLSPYDPVEIYKSMLGTQFYASKAMHDLGFPNTYTFSKCVCEHLLLQESPVSTMIVRPSIVGPSIESPFEGWAGEKPSTLVAAACLYMGYQWTLWCFGSHSVPYIPVDILSRFILAKAFSDKEEEGTGDSSANESLSTDDTFERISGASDIFSDSGYELLTTSLKIKNFRHGRIYNAVWDTKSAHTALFSWHEYAVATLQLGVVLRYLDRATAYFGLFVSTRLMPSLQLSTESFALVHSVLVLGPIRIILKLCRFVGYAPKHLSKLSLFLDLPLLFFPFTNKSFHFRSELIAPDTVDGERYLFSCAVAAHRFLVAAQSRTRPANGKKSADSAVEASQDMTKLIVGGCAHDALCSDIWWALSQPRGSYFIRLAGYFFRKILRAAASVVTVDATSFAPAIAALCSKDNANVYLILAPTHRSFFDFILLSYLFFELPELCIDIPFVAAAEEFERLPLVGWVARSLRAFYIERGRGNADPQLTATLEDLKQKQLSSFGSCLEVFLEGTRSRDRRFVHPRTGFLKCLKQSGGGHLVVPITICYEGIPEQNVLAEEAAGTSRRKLNLGGMFLWLKRVAEGKVSLGRIHVAASDPLHMKCETADDFKRFAAHVQHKQQEMVVVSNYHLQATAKLLKIDPNATKDGMIRLGCKFWPDVESTRSGCSYRLELPDDPSDLCTIMLQCSHTLAPLLHSTRPKWSAWLNRLDPVGAGLIWTGEASTQLIADSIAALFDDADDCVEQAISLLNANGFSSPKLEHLLQTAKRLSEKQTPLPLLRAAASRVLNESRVQDALHISLHDASHKLILSGQPNLKLADSDEVLGSWGFQDSGFLIQASKKGQHFVTMKGNRYGVCGKPLTNLLPFIETEMQVRVNPLHEAFACPEIWLETTSSKFEATTIAKLRSIMSRASFSTLDRARHGTGHSQEDVFLLRSGTAVRIPDAVVWPSSEQEVETLVALAKVNCWCLIPFGGGTNVSNATRCPSEEIEARPIISVDMKEMSRILWLNEEDGLAHVQAGITGRELVEEMARRGFTIGHEPDSIEFSTLGGWIATKASGMKRSKYGNIEDIVKSVRVVGSKGMLWKGDGSDEVVPGRVAEGLDLCSFMIGSEGCLGVITSAVIRVWPMPEAKEHESVILPCFEHGLRFMRDVVKLGQNIPASVRLLDNEHFRLGQALRPESSFLRSQLQNAILKVATYWNGPLDHKSVVCATICYEGSHEEVQAQKRSMKRLASMYGGMMLGSRVGKAGYDLTFMIAYLRDFAMTYHFLGESFETFCPWSKIETLIEATKKRIVEEHCSRHLPGVPFVGCRVTQLYHEGACLYFYFCMNFEGVQNASEVFAEIERAARQEILKQGGSLSHHHGIGKIRAPLMKGRASSAFDHAMASVKKGMDQDNIFGARNGPYSSCSDS